jgi:LysM repeat protein
MQYSLENMMSFRRMLPFLLVNIIVSAAVVLAILYWWDTRKTEQAAITTATAVAIAPPTGIATAAAIPLSTDTPEPGDEPLMHVVKAGETLGSLAEFYEVSLEDIMTINGLSDPNVLSVGQELIIPIGGIPTATPLPTSPSESAPATPPTPIPTEEPLTAGEADVQITAVTGVNSLAEEVVQLTNFGGRQIALLDWKLADADGFVYTFGQVTLFGDGAAFQVHTEKGTDGPADLYWGLETPVWESGERVTLLDPEGSIQATFDIP